MVNALELIETALVEFVQRVAKGNCSTDETKQLSDAASVIVRINGR
ncbi:hypothetical protein FACS1894184_17060 [Clostridia bacterium]|nr:hypothetical protein FACS1894184_17060 [Clostridia bacterium]